ncbi:MAG TPA: DUF2513 domain-containing protein [Candidatus Latescibacteria bacterium]|nr:DUF2513 domain-containing protein [Candidatus Latescibacterota bacterium]
MELVRELLLYFEAKPDYRAIQPTQIEIPGREQQDVHYHILLLCQAGLLDHERVASSTTPSRLVDAYPFGLTWAGHEFLDAARSDSVWEQATRRIGAEGLGLGFGLIQALLVSLAKEKLQLS